MTENEIRKTLEVFKTDNGLIEIRIFNTLNKSEIYSGIFDNAEALIPEIIRFDREPYNIYFLFNELKDALSGLPQLNRMVKGAKTVQNKDIKYRRWFFIDFDPIREGDVKDIASTDEEMENARQTALEARRFLRSLGFPQCVVCRSGNGFHELFKVNNLPSDDETDRVFSNVLKYLAMRFTDDKVDVDVKVGNSARLTKFYSSVSRKGGNTEKRPHRKSEIVVVPPKIECVEWETLRKVSQMYENSQVTDPVPENNNYYRSEHREKFNLDDFLSQNGIEVLKEQPYGDGRKLVLKTCPFDPAHGKDSAIFVSRDGAISFSCFHAGCSGNNWRTLRLKFDPHAYDKKEYEPRPPYQRQPYVPERKKYQIKETNPELGKKWLCMSDIQKIDLSSIETLKTGFRELDGYIVGLNAGEVSILSGSNSSGKSSWLNTLILNIVQHNFKVALWSGELRPDILKSWIQMAAAGKSYLKPSMFTDKYYVPNQVADKIDTWLDGKLFIYNNEYSSRWEQIFNDMDEMLKLGVKLFALDNLFSLDINLFDGDKNNQQKELILQICQFAKKNQVHIILVAHPRKCIGFLRKTDISGTADLTNAVDNVFICHRVNNDFMKMGGEFLGNAKIQEFAQFGNCIEICKNRMYGTVDKICGMYYEIESRRFKNEMDECVHYGWEETPTQTTLSMENEFDNNSFDNKTDPFSGFEDMPEFN